MKECSVPGITCNFSAGGGSVSGGMIVRIFIGVVVGGVLGFGYYKVVGCPTGTCPLTRNPWITTIYGALLGVLIASSSR